MRDRDYSCAGEFLAQFFAGTDHAVELRALGDGPPAIRFTRDPEIVADFCTRYDVPGRGCYFAVATRRNGSHAGKRSDLAELPGVWVEIDCYKFGTTKETVVAALRLCPLPPTIIIDSGGGIHAYWLFREAMDARLAADSPDSIKDDVDAVLRQLAGVFCGDIASCDITRILRLPGTHNSKTGTLRPVGLIEAHWQARYEFSDLVEMLDYLRPLITLPGQPMAAKSNGFDPFADLAKRYTFKPPIDVEARLRAMSYMAPGDAAIHPTRCSVSSSLAAQGAEDDEIFELLLAATRSAAGLYGDKWNWKREEKLIRDEIRTAKAKYARDINPAPKRRPGPIVQLRPQQQDVPAEKTTQSSSVEQLIAHFNTRYMVVNEAGKAVVYEPATDPGTHRHHYWRISFHDFENMYANMPIVLGKNKKGDPIIKPAGNVWLTHANRRQYLGGVVFDPSGNNPPNSLNLWRGFAVDPVDKPGAWSLLEQHIFEIICNENNEHFVFLMKWLARMVQQPASQGECSVVLKGGEGTGKGTLARALMRMLGQHALTISNAKHLVGSFNVHLRDTVFLFADEAFWAGDRAHTGILKAIITEPYLMIEGKYQNATQMPNYIHLLMSSNNRWVVPADLDSRRFFVLCVSDRRAGDHAYFSSIWKQMDEGGYQAMLYDLLNMNISDYNPRAVPVTDGLQEQRKLSLAVPEEWWQEVLYQGYVYRSKLGIEEHFSEWYQEVTTQVLYDAYQSFAKNHGDRHPMAREEFGRFMVRMGNTAVRLRQAVVGEHITDAPNSFGGTSRTAKLVISDRAYGYRVGVLDKARDKFCHVTGLKIEWPLDDK